VEAAWWHPMRATDPALTWLRSTLHQEALHQEAAGPATREVAGMTGS
jgi:hypothetical protein